MRERVNINKKSNNNSSAPVQNSFLRRTAITQLGQDSNAVPPQQDIEHQQYQQDRFEATGLEIQAKYGTITPEGQERLAVLQAKKAEFWQRYSGKTGLYGHDFSQIPLYSTDAPRQRTIQPKLTIGTPGDKYEQEADRVAAQVVNHINSPVTQQLNQNLQREEIPVIQTRPWLRLQAKNEGMAAPAALETSIQQARNGGQLLADNIRKPMEQAFVADFSGVRVHTDAKSDELNQSVQAKAFTTGQDVFFRQGEYQPGSREGQELIAHELTHVVQQSGCAVQRSPLSPQQLLQQPVIETPLASVSNRVIQLNGDGIGQRVGDRGKLKRMTERQQKLYGGKEAAGNRRKEYLKKEKERRAKEQEDNRRDLWKMTRPSFTDDTWTTMLSLVKQRRRPSDNVILYECVDGTYCPRKRDRVGNEAYVTLDHKINWKQYILENAEPEEDGSITKESAKNAYNDPNNLEVMSNVQNAKKNGPKNVFD